MRGKHALGRARGGIHAGRPTRRGKHARRRRGISRLFVVNVAVITVIAVGWTVKSGTWNRVFGATQRRTAAAVAAATPAGPIVTPPAPPEDTAAPSGGGQWIVEENRKRGTRAWQLTRRAPTGFIEGYADQVSARSGDHVQLFVSTDAPRFRVEAYRIGYYQGLGGRLVWRSHDTGGREQPPPARDPATNMVQTGWTPSLQLSVGPGWTPGEYALKLVASNGAQAYVPLTVRDDDSHAALVLQSSVTTWQAYNDWGGYSLYHGPPGDFGDRATVVSFDRPYAIGRGAGDLLDGNEITVIQLVEKLGLDVTYWTDVDFHERPGLLLNHRALITLGHDEYWSLAMRNGALAARAAGVNLAFLGANADYRHIRLAASSLGPDREEVNYRDPTIDPLYGVNDRDVTTNWRIDPDARPESALNGDLYECNPVSADMVIPDASSWVFAHTGLANGAVLPGLVGSEYDRVQTGYPTPRSIQILAHSPVVCGDQSSASDMTYYTAASGAGVFDSGTSMWTTAIGARCVLTGACDDGERAVGRITANVLHAFAAGPAGRAHPSLSNLSSFGLSLTVPIDP